MKQIYTKQGLTPPSDNTMARTVAQISRILQGKGRLGTEAINLEKNTRAGTLLVKKMFSGGMFGNAWSTAAQQEVYNIIDEKLGREAGTFENFKYRLKNIIREDTGLSCASRASLWRKGKRIGNNVEIITHDNEFSFVDIHSKKDLILANLIIKNFKT